MKKKKLGEMLRERGHVSLLGLAQAVEDQHGKITLLGELLLERGLVTKTQLVSALEEITNIPYVDCDQVTPDPAALQKITEALARKHLVLPIAQQGAKLVVIMAEPQNSVALDEIRFAAATNVSPRFGFREEILRAIDKHYGPASAVPLAAPETSFKESNSGIEFISTSSRQSNQDAMAEIQSELLNNSTPSVKVVSEVIKAASEKRASDIHIEPQAKEVIIRIRVDGVLRDLRHVPRSMQNSLISRVKILSDMDIAERRAPQDGRFLVRMGTTSIDMRVSTLPTQYGEKVVLRLLNSENGVVTLEGLCMPAPLEASFRKVLSLPQGLVLVTGPTGSGKSTTLYTALNFVRRPAINIVTVEDPVEYVLPGINQVHVNNKAGLTFASVLRSILRQDPNVIMIGEIRDKETAEIAMKAAQTGHLVLSTLHTNDSLSAITRLLDLEIPGYLIASSITAILAQRLVRRLCECRVLVPSSPKVLQTLAEFGAPQPIPSVYVPGGCPVCEQTGYRGRIGIYEMLLFDDAVREAVRDGHSLGSLRGIVRSRGMKLMQEDAIEKVRSGITSLEEVTRVVSVQVSDSAVVCHGCSRRIDRLFLFCPFCAARQARPGASVDENSAQATMAVPVTL